MKSVEDVVNGTIATTDITCVQKVVVLKGYKNEGKTAVLKEVIKRLHDQFPGSWRMRRKYDAQRLAVDATGDCPAVFEIDGIVVVIYTGGDNPSVIAGVFALAARYRARIVVVAQKVSQEGVAPTRAQIAYEIIEQQNSFETIYVDICGQRLRSIEAEQIIADEIVDEVKCCVQEIVDKRVGVLSKR